MKREELNELLVRAAENGKVDNLRHLLQAGADVHDKDEKALRWAAREGHLEIVKILLQAGADVHANKDQALCWAARYGREETVRFLLQEKITSGFDLIRARCARSWWFLHENPEFARIRRQEMAQKADVNANNDWALHWAARCGQTETVKILLQAGANVRDKGYEPLCAAAHNGHTETVKVLLQAGGDIERKYNYYKLTPLSAAAKNGHTETVKFLLQAFSTCGSAQNADVHAEYNSALLWAAENGQSETVQVLLKAGADVHSQNEQALLYAAYRGHVKTFQVLLKAGADFGILDLRKLRLRILTTPVFLLSLPEYKIAEIETLHPEIRKCEYRQKISFLKRDKDENSFGAKISLADLYYRPGEAGYYRAISF